VDSGLVQRPTLPGSATLEVGKEEPRQPPGEEDGLEVGGALRAGSSGLRDGGDAWGRLAGGDVLRAEGPSALSVPELSGGPRERVAGAGTDPLGVELGPDRDQQARRPLERDGHRAPQ